ncbi:MAG: Ig-like domain-containing protein [Candidatus Binataceae bacterium]
MSSGRRQKNLRGYDFDRRCFLVSLLALTVFVAACQGGDGNSANARVHHTPTPVSSPTPTPSSTSTPVVVSVYPPLSGCGSQGVPTNQKIVVSFNEAMDPATLTAATFTVTAPGPSPVAGTVSYDASNDTAIFTPTDPLTASTAFTGTITTGAKSAAEIPLASNFVWTFETSGGANTTTPTVVSTNPANLAENVATNQSVTAVFSEAMDSRTITGATFTLTDPSSDPVDGTVTYSPVGASAVFTPTSPLSALGLYTATITTGATDLTGNAVAATFTWTFTTGAGPDLVEPTVTSTIPADGASSVAPNAAINATFSKAMNPSTLSAATFILTAPGASSVAGKVTYDAADSIVTFTPVSSLAADTLYDATVTTGATDLEGNALADSESWSFTTGSTQTLSPVNLGAASGYGALAQATITNAGNTVINGDIGLNPGISITGFPPGVVNGTIQLDNGPAIAALASLTTAYNAIAGLSGANVVGENLAGQVLPPGLYTSAATSFEITGGNLTLDANGDTNAVWIFQMPASTLTLTTPLCSVILTNGAQFSNVYWQVGSSATAGVDCVLEGNVLADTSVTMNVGSTLQGRALGGAIAPSGAVSLDATNLSAVGGCNQ